MGVPWEPCPDLGPDLGLSDSQPHHGFLSLPARVSLSLPLVLSPQLTTGFYVSLIVCPLSVSPTGL